jgi:hypothetical protein
MLLRQKTRAKEDDPKGQVWTSSVHRTRESGNRTTKNRLIATESNHEAVVGVQSERNVNSH